MAVAVAAAAAVAPVGKAAGREGTACAVAGEHSRAFPGGDEEGAQTVAAVEETQTVAEVEETYTVAEVGETHTAAAVEEAHTVAVAVLFIVSVRICSALRLSQWRLRRTLSWRRRAGGSCDAASQYLEMAG